MILSLFGTVSGFQSLVFGKPPTGLTDQWIDFRNELSLQEGDWGVVVRRRQVTEGIATWIGLYQHGHELGARRGGHFGAGIWLINEWVPGDLVIRLLWAHADELARIGMSAGQFTRTLEDIERNFQWPQNLGSEVMRSIQPLTGGGLGTGDKPTALLDLTGKDDASGWLWSLAALQCGPGLDGFDRAILVGSSKVMRQVMAGASVTVLTPNSLMESGSKALTAAQQRLSEGQAHLLQVEQERATLREGIQREMQQRWEHKVAHLATQRESALTAEVEHLYSQVDQANQRLRAAQDEVGELRAKLDQGFAQHAQWQAHQAVGSQTPAQGNPLQNGYEWPVPPEPTPPPPPPPPHHVNPTAGGRGDAFHSWPFFREGRTRLALLVAALLATVTWWGMSTSPAPPDPATETRIPHQSPPACPMPAQHDTSTLQTGLNINVPSKRFREAASMVWAISCASVRPDACRIGDVAYIEESLAQGAFEGPRGMGVATSLSLPNTCLALTSSDVWVLMGPGAKIGVADKETSPARSEIGAGGVRSNTTEKDSRRQSGGAANSDPISRSKKDNAGGASSPAKPRPAPQLQHSLNSEG